MEIPFFKPSISPLTLQRVTEVLKSGWLTTGQKTEEFENQFAKYVGAKYAIMVNSGTAALHLSLASLGITKGDEIITTPYTFAATTEVIENLGARPVLIDVNETDLNIDVKKIPNAITSKTKAILPVHFSGNPCEMNTLLEISQKYQLKIIEDAAHCTPAFYHNRPIGSIGDATCFSFYANKCITTGEGGMLTTNNTNIANLSRSLRLHGLSKDALNRYRSGAKWEYDITHSGFKYNPTDISAVMGIEQLKQADEFLKKRVHIIEVYQSYFKNDPRLKLIWPNPLNQSSWHLFPVRLLNGLKSVRNQIINRLHQVNISVAVHFKPLHLHSYYINKYQYKPSDFPIATDAFEREISLPVYPQLQEDEIHYIASQFKTILDSY